jgi:fibronectin-binding autotransporter adhesin
VIGPGAAVNPTTANMISNELVLKGSLTIQSPSLLVTNSLNVTIAGDMTVNGTGNYRGGAAGSFNTTIFNGTGPQLGTLNATSSFNNMTVNKTIIT